MEEQPEPQVQQRVKNGRPKVSTLTKEEYRKEYYANHRDKWTGDGFCYTCNLLYSKVNKSRHMRSNPHLKKLCELIENSGVSGIKIII